MNFNAYSDSSRGIGGVSVVSAGHIFAEEGRAVDRPHGRPDYLLFYIARGEEEMTLGDRLTAHEGSFILFRPHEPQIHLHTEREGAEFYYVHFTAPPDFDLFGLESSRIYPPYKSSSLCDLFESIIDELGTKRPAYEQLAAAGLFSLLGRLARRVAGDSSPVGQYYGRIARVVQSMNKEYHLERDLHDYAEMCNMSRFHFARIFREITGHSPIEYRNRIRLDHARELLSDTRDPVSEIAERVGYSSAVYFCDVFRRATGLSPTEYRRRAACDTEPPCTGDPQARDTDTATPEIGSLRSEGQT